MIPAEITTLPQAREEFARAMESMQRVSKFFEQHEAALHQVMGHMLTARDAMPKITAPPRFYGGGPATPDGTPTTTPKVLAVFESAGRPLWPKDVVKALTEQGWQAPEPGKEYEAVSGSIAYLYSRRKALGKDEMQGYFLKGRATDFFTPRGIDELSRKGVL